MPNANLNIDEQVKDTKRLQLLEAVDAIDLNNFDVAESATHLKTKMPANNSVILIHGDASRHLFSMTNSKGTFSIRPHH